MRGSSAGRPAHRELAWIISAGAGEPPDAYPRGAPEGIADQAKAAMALLARIQKGDATLGLPAVDTPAEAVSDAPVVIAPGRRAYPDWLADY